MTKKINNYLKNLHPIWFVLLFYAVFIVVVETVKFLLVFLNVPNVQYNVFSLDEDMGLGAQFFTVVIFAPLVETLVWQLLLYWLLSKIRYFKKNPIWIILISAIGFGISHNYSTHYIIWATIIGFLFMYAYVLRLKNQPFWTVVAIHALANAVTLLRNSL